MRQKLYTRTSMLAAGLGLAGLLFGAPRHAWAQG